MRRLRFVLLITLAACGSAETPPTSGNGHPAISEDAVGITTREEILTHDRWESALAESAPNQGTSQSLASVPVGANVDVFLGTWCGDSIREVARLFAALDAAGPVPFEVRYIGVDRSKSEPADLLAGRDIGYVPTFVVTRDGAEVGRIIESSPGGIEEDLRKLLVGETNGVISGRTDL